MRLDRKVICTLLMLASAASSAGAQSLEARKMQATAEAKMSHQAELTDRACGTNLKTAFAWNTFDPAEALRKDPAAWCQAGLDALEDLCGDPLGKQAVAAKVKTLTCAGAATPAASLDATGNLTFSFSLTPNQNKLLVRSYLEKNL
jgi:hypothetical protein